MDQDQPTKPILTLIHSCRITLLIYEQISKEDKYHTPFDGSILPCTLNFVPKQGASVMAWFSASSAPKDKFEVEGRASFVKGDDATSIAVTPLRSSLPVMPVYGHVQRHGRHDSVSLMVDEVRIEVATDDFAVWKAHRKFQEFLSVFYDTYYVVSIKVVVESHWNGKGNDQDNSW